MESEKTIVIPPHVMSRQVGDETVILDLASGMYFGLNPVGARVWQLLSSGSALADIVTTLVDEFDVAEDQLQKDVDTLINELVTRGLVEMA